MSNFDKIIGFILAREGGYVNHPSDPGGETNFGISKRAFPQVDIKHLTEDGAKVIYKKYYWDKADCEKLPFELAACQMDTAVNSGISRANQMLLQSCEDWEKYLEVREKFYEDIVAVKPSQRVFLAGWKNRLVELKKFILSNQ